MSRTATMRNRLLGAALWLGWLAPSGPLLRSAPADPQAVAATTPKMTMVGWISTTA